MDESYFETCLFFVVTPESFFLALFLPDGVQRNSTFRTLPVERVR